MAPNVCGTLYNMKYSTYSQKVYSNLEQIIDILRYKTGGKGKTFECSSPG